VAVPGREHGGAAGDHGRGARGGTGNTLLLQGDRNAFNFDISDMDWADIMDDSVKVGPYNDRKDRSFSALHFTGQGARLYILGEDPSSLPSARTRLHRLYWLETGLQVQALRCGTMDYCMCIVCVLYYSIQYTVYSMIQYTSFPSGGRHPAAPMASFCICIFLMSHACTF
jgi:hypothetical protein